MAGRCGKEFRAKDGSFLPESADLFESQEARLAGRKEEEGHKRRSSLV